VLGIAESVLWEGVSGISQGLFAVLAQFNMISLSVRTKLLCEGCWEQRGPVPHETANSKAIAEKVRGPEVAQGKNKLTLPLCVSDL